MSNLNFNKVILAGRLAADPVARTTSTGKAYSTFTLAVNRKGKDQPTDFFQALAWEKVAEFISSYFHKGSSILVIGKIQNRKYTDKDGKERYATDIVVESAEFVDSRAEAGETTVQGYSSPADVPKASAPAAAPAPVQATMVAPNFEPLGDDEELPF